MRDLVVGMFRGEVHAIRVLGSCLVMLSDVLTVYDVVTDEILYTYSLRNAGNPDKQSSHAARMRLVQLAANQRSRSFALAVPLPGSTSHHPSLKPGARSELLVFSADDPGPRFTQTFPHLVTSVLPVTGSSGYVVVDSAAQVWSIKEGPESAGVMRPLAETKLVGDEDNEREVEADGAMRPARAEDDNEGPADNDSAMRDVTDEDESDPMYDDDDDDRAHAAVVAPQRLAEILDAAPSFAMPPIDDVFYRVAGLFSAKPGT